MDISKIYSKEDLDKLIINSAEETTYLEFKDGRSLNTDDKAKNEISKDVSAFANADGGILIYGIREDKHIATELTPFDGDKFTKEWLEQVINSKVNPTPKYTIDPIRIDNDPKKSIYVVRIPKGDRPYQAADKSFYKRRNFIADKMDEYEIREAYSRPGLTQLTILPPEIRGNVVRMVDQRQIAEYQVQISISVKNDGNSIESMYKVEVRIPYNLYKSSVRHTEPFYSAPNRKEDWYQVYTFPHTSALYQSEIALITCFSIFLRPENIDAVDTVPIIARLYYSSGIENLEIKLLPSLKHEDHVLRPNCFKPER
jgi:hypothetical protein